MVSVGANGNTSWVCDHSLVSYELEQSEMLRSPDYSCKRCAQFLRVRFGGYDHPGKAKNSAI